MRRKELEEREEAELLERIQRKQGGLRRYSLHTRHEALGREQRALHGHVGHTCLGRAGVLLYLWLRMVYNLQLSSCLRPLSDVVVCSDCREKSELVS